MAHAQQTKILVALHYDTYVVLFLNSSAEMFAEDATDSRVRVMIERVMTWYARVLQPVARAPRVP